MTDYPSERIRSISIVVVLFLSMGASIGAAQYAFGLFVPPMEDTFGWTRTQISASLSFVAAGSLFAPVLGRLMDRFGARPILVYSLLLSASSYLARPLMTELWHWYALSFVQFITFAGATVLPVGRLVAVWFGDRRGRVMGLAAAGPNFGGLVLPVMVAALLATANWETAYLAMGVVLVVIAILGQLIIREQPRRRPPSGPARGATALDPSKGATVRQALRTPAFYTITFATVSAFFTYSIVLPHVIVHLINEGLSAQKASFVLGATAMCGMVGKIVFGYLSERITAKKAFVVDQFGQAVFVVAVVMVPAGGLTWMSPVYGFFLGGVGVLAPLIIQEFFGLKHFGAVSGLSSMATVASFGIGPIIAGLSFDMTGSYASSFLIAAAFFLFAALLLMFTRSASSLSFEDTAQDGASR